ncbi:MAG TPA: MBL fold metallo-hydrolase [Kofleriaceae bacterium]|nr:MBL fold metallo-hydrolase [Kofleriaceae bacterium]
MQLVVFTSGIWQTTSTIVEHRGACIVVDPAYFPRELDAIAARVRELGHAATVVFTHGHWDHVMGHTALPGAPVHVNRTLADAIAAGDPRAARYLEDAREFDSRWYVPRPHGHRWPAALAPIDETTRDLAGIRVRALQLPGHSPDDLALVVEDTGTLLVGDYLSPCEIPFVDDARAYRRTLDRLIDVLGEVRDVIPGHGPRMPAAEALAIARADVEYLDRLQAATTRDAAEAIELPRARDVVGMRDHHLENVAKLGF